MICTVKALLQDNKVDWCRKKTKAAGQTWTESSLTHGNFLFPVHQQLEQWL